MHCDNGIVEIVHKSLIKLLKAIYNETFTLKHYAVYDDETIPLYLMLRAIQFTVEYGPLSIINTHTHWMWMETTYKMFLIP